MAKIDATNGVWVHATNVVTLGIPVQHTLDTGTPDAEWRIDLKAAGEIVLRFVDGQEQRFAVKAGDTLTGVGEHLYLSLQIRPGTPEAVVERAGDAEQAPAAQHAR